MSKRAFYHVECRFVTTLEALEKIRVLTSSSEKFVWVTTAQRLRVCTFKGVPGSTVDLLLPDAFEDSLICEIGLKSGSFDGKKRWRIAFRSWPHKAEDGKLPNLKYPGPGKILIEEDHDQSLTICAIYPGGMWGQEFARLRSVPLTEDRRGILIWHWKHHFRFLPEDEVRQLADVWVSLPKIAECQDLSVLNRTASAALYDLGRSLGWVKLTLKDKKRYGVSPDAPQWQRRDSILLRKRVDGSPGIGEYSLNAARGSVMRCSDQDGYIMTSHGHIEID